MKTDKCDFDTDLLRADMDAGQSTWESLLSAGKGSFGRSTVQRALSGKNRLEKSSAQAIAIALGQAPDRYILLEQKAPRSDRSLQLEGIWHAFFVHDPRDTGPTVVRETLIVKQSGSKISGIYDRAADGIGEDFEMEGTVVDKIISGKYWVPNRDSTVGLGLFHLGEKELGDWFEGICTWVDSERINEIAFSKNIWVKTESSSYNEYIRIVNKIMDDEKRLLLERRKTETY